MGVASRGSRGSVPRTARSRCALPSGKLIPLTTNSRSPVNGPSVGSKASTAYGGPTISATSRLSIPILHWSCTAHGRRVSPEGSLRDGDGEEVLPASRRGRACGLLGDRRCMRRLPVRSGPPSPLRDSPWDSTMTFWWCRARRPRSSTRRGHADPRRRRFSTRWRIGRPRHSD